VKKLEFPATFMRYDDKTLDKVVAAGTLSEVECDEQAQDAKA